MSVAEDGRLSWVSSLRMAALTVLERHIVSWKIALGEETYDAIDISVAGNDCLYGDACGENDGEEGTRL
jgi:hypothetical protein